MYGKLRNMTSLYLVDGERVLCLYRIGSRVANANNRYVGAAGGHFEPDELNDARACVLREAWEELGLREEDLQDLRLRYITCRLVGGEIRQNYYFFAGFSAGRELRSTEGNLKWIPFAETGELHMPLSAFHMLQHYVTKGRLDDCLYAGITQKNGTEFVPLEEFEG